MAMTRYQGSAAPPPTPALLPILRAYQAAGRRATWLLQIDLAADPGHGGARYPDCAVVVAGNVHPPASAKRRALARDVGRSRPSGPQQPLPERGIQAAGDRVLDRPAVDLEERAHLEGRCGARRIGTGDAQIEFDRVWPQRQHRVGAGQQHGDPAWPVVGPLRVDDLGAIDPELRGDPLDHRLADRDY